MNEFTVQELKKAKASLSSTFLKCEKIQEGGKLRLLRKP